RHPERSKRDQSVTGNRLRSDETAFESGMDRTRGVGRFFAGVNSPGARFFFTRRQKCSQAKQMIDPANERMNAAVFNAKTAQIFERFLLAQIGKFAFDPGTDYERFRSEMMLRVILDKIDILRGGICLIILCHRCQIGLSDVAGEKSRL